MKVKKYRSNEWTENVTRVQMTQFWFQNLEKYYLEDLDEN